MICGPLRQGEIQGKDGAEPESEQAGDQKDHADAGAGVGGPRQHEYTQHHGDNDRDQVHPARNRQHDGQASHQGAEDQGSGKQHVGVLQHLIRGDHAFGAAYDGGISVWHWCSHSSVEIVTSCLKRLLTFIVLRSDHGPFPRRLRLRLAHALSARKISRTRPRPDQYQQSLMQTSKSPIHGNFPTCGRRLLSNPPVRKHTGVLPNFKRLPLVRSRTSGILIQNTFGDDRPRCKMTPRRGG